MKYSALEAEKAVLSSILIDPKGDCMDRANHLEANDFTTRSHQIIFSSCKSLYSDGKIVDVVTVVQNLTTLGKIKEIDGAYCVHKLATEFSIPGNIEHYIEEIKERARLFRLNEIASKIQNKSEACDDVSELVSEVEKDIYDIQSNKKSGNSRDIASDELIRQIENYDSQTFGITSGITSFDKAFGGFQKSQYYALGGRPSAGKTAMADQITVHQLEQGRAVLYISLESSTDRVITKMACKHAGLVFTRFQRKLMNDSELASLKKSAEFLRKSPLILQKTYGLSVRDIRSLIRREHRNNSIELVVIDYLQKISIPSNMDERRGVSEASLQVSQACLDTGVPALVLVQLNRDGGIGRPTMSNIKESGQIEQDADNIGLLWPEVDPFSIDPNDLLPVIFSIEKSKDGARGIDEKVYFDRPLMKFKERK